MRKQHCHNGQIPCKVQKVSESKSQQWNLRTVTLLSGGFNPFNAESSVTKSLFLLSLTSRAQTVRKFKKGNTFIIATINSAHLFQINVFRIQSMAPNLGRLCMRSIYVSTALEGAQVCGGQVLK